MGTLQRFKWQRALPIPSADGNSGFFSWSLKNMRQIPTMAGTVNDGAPVSPIITANVPAGSWGLGKLLFIRGIYNFAGPPGTAPAFYSAGDSVSTDQSGSFSFPVPGAFPVTGSVYTVYIERLFLRQDPNIWVFDRGDALAHSYFDNCDFQPHLFPTLAITPPFNYGIPIAVNVELNPAGTWPGASFTCIWSEAFLEQATNLGKLP